MTRGESKILTGHTGRKLICFKIPKTHKIFRNLLFRTLIMKFLKTMRPCRKMIIREFRKLEFSKKLIFEELFQKFFSSNISLYYSAYLSSSEHRERRSARKREKNHKYWKSFLEPIWKKFYVGGRQVIQINLSFLR